MDMGYSLLHSLQCVQQHHESRADKYQRHIHQSLRYKLSEDERTGSDVREVCNLIAQAFFSGYVNLRL